MKDMKIKMSDALAKSKSVMIVRFTLVEDWRFRLGRWLIKAGCRTMNAPVKFVKEAA